MRAVSRSLAGLLAAALVSPWTTTLDLGNEIAPQGLVAVAHDRDGKRMGETRKWINRATSEAEAGFALYGQPVEEGPPEVTFVLAGRVRKKLERLLSEDNGPWPWKRPLPLALSRLAADAADAGHLDAPRVPFSYTLRYRSSGETL